MRAETVVYDLLMRPGGNLDSLLILDRSLTQFFPAAPEYTIRQLAEADEYLLTRLGKIDMMFEQLRSDVAAYYAKQDELERWRINVDEKIRIARNAISVWAQSHRNLGAGIEVPPLIDVAGFASGLVGSAAKTVVP
jgi:hypothetical protein